MSGKGCCWDYDPAQILYLSHTNKSMFKCCPTKINQTWKQSPIISLEHTLLKLLNTKTPSLFYLFFYIKPSISSTQIKSSKVLALVK